LERIRELIKAREHAYEACADVILDVDDLDAEECADRLARWLEVNA
jgi:shikimate kinase